MLPSLFTVGTLICGYFALLATLRGTLQMSPSLEAARWSFDSAARAIGWAILFDGLDGRIARLTNSASEFGREFDSLADVIAFGIAPAFLAFAWGIRSMETVLGTDVVQHVRQAGWIITFAYVICGAARLARFNIQSTKASVDRRYFVGLPIPAAAGVVAAVVHFLKSPANDWRFGMAWLTIIGLLAFLMVSRVRYYSFKTIDLRRPRSYLFIIVLGLVAYGVAVYSESVLLVLAFAYAFSPVLRMFPRPRVQPPAPQKVHAS
ncbi:MAG TPA: CDP-diacylglycerol--serine O-phosphatidyltransferase [Candidatus Methylomirabilis sp.]|nr:CDP-diacylglycerol--serine O-phosphatidyltransferase [Candidatus Methylomirabilis sp.]